MHVIIVECGAIYLFSLFHCLEGSMLCREVDAHDSGSSNDVSLHASFSLVGGVRVPTLNCLKLDQWKHRC